jgi:hypothetical protein
MGYMLAADGRLGSHTFPESGHQGSNQKRVADERSVRRRLVSTM